jgi:hypothetical protein
VAYISQEEKKTIVDAVKPIFKKYGIKGTFGVRNYSNLVVNIKSGKIDFYSEFASKKEAEQFGINVNPYHFEKHFTGKSKDFLIELFRTIKIAGKWYDNSDVMTDYFDTKFYIDVNIGKWDKGYQYSN